MGIPGKIANSSFFPILTKKEDFQSHYFKTYFEKTINSEIDDNF